MVVAIAQSRFERAVKESIFARASRLADIQSKKSLVYGVNSQNDISPEFGGACLLSKCNYDFISIGL
jgi:hypothetical protein